MKRLIRRISFAIAASLIALTSAHAAELPRTLHGQWCMAPESNDVYEFYVRSARCDDYLQEMQIARSGILTCNGGCDCKFRKVTGPQNTRRGPRYWLKMQCSVEHHRPGHRHIRELILLDDASLMLSTKQ
jgi:hypothetical protein